MAKKVDVDDLLSSDEVAQIIGLSNPRGVSVYRRREGFPVPVVDKGRCVLWLRADIEAWRDGRS